MSLSELQVTIVSDRNVRTNVLLAWMLSNGVLAAVILHGEFSETQLHSVC